MKPTHLQSTTTRTGYCLRSTVSTWRSRPAVCGSASPYRRRTVMLSRKARITESRLGPAAPQESPTGAFWMISSRFLLRPLAKGAAFRP
ncbi:hypothetical protein GCM10010358_39230 [Streptomyces minutiscleroticus]|uniref:Uncharacterized protein n=1 Tax=Streptomyces minutiscleroticus TaxID=68238 RepID=A0A918NMN4_9ACTN|nr:hypothetical protein GCM10010358_39230 [Streptomyces minutiscleroticus]